MSLGSIIRIVPADLVFTLPGAGDETSGILDGDWDRERFPLDQTDKHRAMVQRYVERLPWEKTILFTNIYARRFAAGQMVRGAANLKDLAAQYYDRVDSLYGDMKTRGFRFVVDGREVPLPNVHIGADGEPLLGNNGNHRVAMAQILRLPFILARIQTVHARAVGKPIRKGTTAMEFPQKLPEGATAIPAMTTDAERRAYYRLAKEMAPEGAVVELGAWLGASTVFLAAGVRDSGAQRKVHVFDRWLWDPSHARKVEQWNKDHVGAGYVPGPVPTKATMFDSFKKNMGDLIRFVEPKPGEIKSISWRGGPIGLLVCDAPKRVREISAVLGALAPSIHKGAKMAWQDFAHFPSYEIVACMSRLEGRHLEFEEAIYPGTTAVFSVKRPWNSVTVDAGALAIEKWTTAEIVATWERWTPRLPEGMRARFQCGAAMFLCDIGDGKSAKARLRAVLCETPDQVLPKWRYLKEHRQNLAARYQPLIDIIEEFET